MDDYRVSVLDDMAKKKTNPVNTLGVVPYVYEIWNGVARLATMLAQLNPASRIPLRVFRTVHRAQTGARQGMGTYPPSEAPQRPVREPELLADHGRMA